MKQILVFVRFDGNYKFLEHKVGCTAGTNSYAVSWITCSMILPSYPTSNDIYCYIWIPQFTISIPHKVSWSLVRNPPRLPAEVSLWRDMKEDSMLTLHYISHKLGRAGIKGRSWNSLVLSVVCMQYCPGVETIIFHMTDFKHTYLLYIAS